MEVTSEEIYAVEGHRREAAAEWADVLERIHIALQSTGEQLLHIAVGQRINKYAMQYVVERWQVNDQLDAMRVAIGHGWLLMEMPKQQATERMTGVTFDEAMHDVITSLRTFARQEVN